MRRGQVLDPLPRFLGLLPRRHRELFALIAGGGLGDQRLHLGDIDDLQCLGGGLHPAVQITAAAPALARLQHHLGVGGPRERQAVAVMPVLPAALLLSRCRAQEGCRSSRRSRSSRRRSARVPGPSLDGGLEELLRITACSGNQYSNTRLRPGPRSAGPPARREWFPARPGPTAGAIWSVFAERRRIVSSLSGRHPRPAARRSGSGARLASAWRVPAGACR